MNSSWDTMDLIWLVGVLVLVLSALSVRRLSFGFVVRSLVSWALIIVLTVLAVAHRNEIGALFATASAKLGIDDQQVDGKTVRIRMAPDGHFWARVKLNGVERRMLIDSGATITAISDETAASANIGTSNGLPAMIETANGTVAAKRGRIEKLAIGPLETEDLGVVVSESFGDLDVLGMNFLSRLHSWRVENRTLILEPRAGASDEGSDATTVPTDAEPRRRAPRGAAGSDEGI
ncbi:TIGR02281 family clan AA aspartic protease [Sphingomonas sp. 7/4-4]|uniref:retropepsin-like aspartic protease family protein n=1 Tax=Sphingomonas sp. 7/4-4 TaxID=3018446 RepID=UPI0022F3AEA2|nr:TIGR02281 family clan AA aspartic protease [Sphingomonas sp. 7/4-4]WBY08667.1 TIGR02281 family clan AA aspartic protease [Sphingomonas sp. 7/4-4]